VPEGHTIHRLAAEHRARFLDRPVRASSPQGTFAAGAALIDGRELTAAEAHGKHLFLGFGPAGWVHVHLGLFGRYELHEPSGGDGAPPPPPLPTVRLRLEHPRGGHADLRGPTACALITEPEKQALHDRLGPDPLRPPDAPGNDPERAWARISRSRTSIAALLMDQKVISGVGNVYRAEVLFRHGVDPYLPGKLLPRETWLAIWSDLTALMREGVRLGRIDTVRPEHTPEAMGRPPRVDDHGGEVYVYRRTAHPCLICTTPIRTAPLATRNLFWCPTCQPPHPQ